MDFKLENLSEDDFESIINMLCQRVLGTGTVSFSKGKDGGRDGRFEGVANTYPSNSPSWEGKFIIQAKHSSKYDESCSDNAFFGNQTSTVMKEIPNIKALVENGELDNYLLFTNRKETARREEAIEYIKKETNVKNVAIIGKETLHSWLIQHDDVSRIYRIGKYALPLIITDFEIKEVIVSFGEKINSIQAIETITNDKMLSIIPKDEKNKINRLSADYYSHQIRQRSLQYFSSIDDFLSRSENETLATIYYNFADELSNKIEVKRSTFDGFEEIFPYLYDLIFEENRVTLNKDKRLIWVFLHHMYFNCHIGRKE